ncbi:hypothetical protein BKA64DRAFT_350270 [Cadophora sp. MPI-SDFR-AT-0126]|nr:hypothetical protein BKA64DRAFT_350270 [Leotiomycetes sp. MPI-SDFR-AT-0126]
MPKKGFWLTKFSRRVKGRLGYGCNRQRRCSLLTSLTLPYLPFPTLSADEAKRLLSSLPAKQEPQTPRLRASERPGPDHQYNLTSSPNPTYPTIPHFRNYPQAADHPEHRLPSNLRAHRCFLLKSVPGSATLACSSPSASRSSTPSKLHNTSTRSSISTVSLPN